MVELPPIDASDPRVPVSINEACFKVPLWETDFRLDDIVDSHRCLKGGQCGQGDDPKCDRCKQPGAWLQAIKAYLTEQGGPAANKISDGAAYDFYVQFMIAAAHAKAALKKKLNETPT